MSYISIENVHKRYNATSVLRGFTLDVDRHEVACLIGPSGCGKSTVLRCINGLEPIDAGDIRVGNITVSEEMADTNTLRRRVGIVFQQFNLFPHMTALANVMSGPVYALGKSSAEAEAIAKGWLERVGLGQKCASKPAQLSGGQQQRVAIARALAVNPAAILFDEPTSALDPKMSAEVMRVIDDLADDPQVQVAMVIVTHDLGAVKRIADVVHVLDHGKVAYSGPAEEAFAPGGPAATLE